MIGHAYGDGVETGGYELRELRALATLQDEGQRAGPELPGQAPRSGRHLGQLLSGGEARDMDDERVETGPALGLEDRSHGAAIGCIGAEAVDGLGRKRDEAAVTQEARCLANSTFACHDCRHERGFSGCCRCACPAQA